MSVGTVFIVAVLSAQPVNIEAPPGTVAETSEIISKFVAPMLLNEVSQSSESNSHGKFQAIFPSDTVNIEIPHGVVFERDDIGEYLLGRLGDIHLEYRREDLGLSGDFEDELYLNVDGLLNDFIGKGEEEFSLKLPFQTSVFYLDGVPPHPEALSIPGVPSGDPNKYVGARFSFQHEPE